jgi:hypothetical protein
LFFQKRAVRRFVPEWHGCLLESRRLCAGDGSEDVAAPAGVAPVVMDGETTSDEAAAVVSGWETGSSSTGDWSDDWGLGTSSTGDWSDGWKSGSSSTGDWSSATPISPTPVPQTPTNPYQ